MAALNIVSNALPLCALLLFINTSNCAQGPLMCYQCDDDPDKNTDVVTDCLKLATCASNEVCYTEIHVRGSALKVKAGCRSKLECQHVEVVGRRDDDVLCSQCCQSNFCNARMCDLKVPSNHTPCLACENVEEGKPCETLKYCSYPEVCSVELHWAFGQTAFNRYTCEIENLCPRRKRFVFLKGSNSHLVCRNCCKGEICNMNLPCRIPH